MLFKRREAVQRHVKRIEFLMVYLEQHLMKDKKDVVEALNRDLQTHIPSDMYDPEGRTWPDGNNKNLTVGFSCTAMPTPGSSRPSAAAMALEKIKNPSAATAVNQFTITGYAEIANTLVIGTGFEAGGKLVWSISEESEAREIPPLARAVQRALWKMPGWEVDNVMPGWRRLEKK